MPGEENPFEVLRKEGFLGRDAEGGGKSSKSWHLLSWMNSHADEIFGWPAKPQIDLLNDEVQFFRGVLLDNALLSLPVEKRMDLKRAYPVGGVWTGLLGGDTLAQLDDENPSFCTPRNRADARERFLTHILNILAKGEGENLELVRGIKSRWGESMKSWLTQCVIRGEVAKAWYGMSLEAQKAFHGDFSVEALVWLLDEIDGLESFVSHLPSRVKSVYEEALGLVAAPFGEGRVDEIADLINLIIGRDEETDRSVDLSEKAQTLRLQLQGIELQPSLEDVPNLIVTLEELQVAHLSGRQAIQACTACHLWAHRLEQEGKFLSKKNGERIERWEIQVLLFHHLVLNGSLDRAKHLFNEIIDQIPPLKRAEIRKTFSQ